MPDFGVLGIAAVVCILLWMWKEDERKQKEVALDRATLSEDHASRAVKLLEDVVGFAGDLVRKHEI